MMITHCTIADIRSCLDPSTISGPFVFNDFQGKNDMKDPRPYSTELGRRTRSGGTTLTATSITTPFLYLTVTALCGWLNTVTSVGTVISWTSCLRNSRINQVG